MRIAEEEIAAHPAQLLEREEPQLVQPVVDQRLSFGLGCKHGDEADEVTRKTRPQAGRDAAGCARSRLLDAEQLPHHGTLDVHPREDRRHHLHVLGAGAGDADLTSGYRRDHRPASGFDVVAPQLVLGAVQRAAALDPNRRRPCSGDADAQLLQEHAELDDVRLARGVTDLASAFRGGRGEQRRLRAGHRRFVQVDRSRLQAVRRLERVAGALAPAHAHRGERFEVRVDGTARREIAARRGQLRTAAPREQRPQQQDRTAEPPDQRRIGFVLDDLGATDAQCGAADPLDLAAEIENEPRHHLDVADPGNVGQHTLFGREQAGGEQWQRGVLVAFDLDAARQTLPALNQ
jgi:hypothetical protein